MGDTETGRKALQALFLEYAAEFEKTYQDDDWARLERFFVPDATYEVVGIDEACELRGVREVLAGTRYSIANFDRRFDTRAIETTAAPYVEDDAFHLPWKATYSKAGLPDLVLLATESLWMRDGRIAKLRDLFDDGMQVKIREWMQAYGEGFSIAHSA